MSMPKITQKCPTCHKPAVYTYRPFCSRRCADIDLGKWLSGSFIIQGSEEEKTSAQAPHAEIGSNSNSEE